MDKDLLRIVIIAVGAVVILGMILWGMFSNRKKNIFSDDKDALGNIDPSLILSTEDDDFDIVPLSTRDNDDYQVKTSLNNDTMPEVELHDEDSDSELDLDLNLDLGLKLDTEELTDAIPENDSVKKQLPALLQLSIVAQDEEGFKGSQLLETCEQVGLVYGSVKVFERLDILGRVDYAVASMLEPGTFPGDNWETYRCPGISFFMQPKEVDNAVAVFDEMINTIGQLSTLLKGDVLDQKQQLLTPEALHEIKVSLV